MEELTYYYIMHIRDSLKENDAPLPMIENLFYSVT